GVTACRSSTSPAGCWAVPWPGGCRCAPSSGGSCAPSPAGCCAVPSILVIRPARGHISSVLQRKGAMHTYHVATHGDDTAAGASTDPLRTLDRAAQLARPGDEVIVQEGEYREWVRPLRGGRSNTGRIPYAAATGERVVIKGSERVRGWEHQDGDVWRAEVPAGLFGSFNPFAEEVAGDWIVY